MPWEHATAGIENVVRQADETHPALFNGEVSITYVGEHDKRSVFESKSTIVTFPFVAARYREDGDSTGT
jgi:hypothetical protein